MAVEKRGISRSKIYYYFLFLCSPAQPGNPGDLDGGDEFCNYLRTETIMLSVRTIPGELDGQTGKAFSERTKIYFPFELREGKWMVAPSLFGKPILPLTSRRRSLGQRSWLSLQSGFLRIFLSMRAPRLVASNWNQGVHHQPPLGGVITDVTAGSMPKRRFVFSRMISSVGYGEFLTVGNRTIVFPTFRGEKGKRPEKQPNRYLVTQSSVRRTPSGKKRRTPMKNIEISPPQTLWYWQAKRRNSSASVVILRPLPDTASCVMKYCFCIGFYKTGTSLHDLSKYSTARRISVVGL